MKTTALILRGGGERGDLEALEERKRALDLKRAMNKASFRSDGHLGPFVKNWVFCAVPARVIPFCFVLFSFSYYARWVVEPGPLIHFLP